jgi:GTP cyclohydrolase IA
MGIVAVSRQVTWSEVYERLSSAPSGKLYGIPRGGAIVAGLTGRAVDQIEQADWVVDDVIDSGKSGELARMWKKPIWGLFDRSRDGLGDHEVNFPWEGPTGRVKRLEYLGRELLLTIGYDPTSPELRETPGRWARWWEEFLTHDPGHIDTAFEAVAADQLVVVGGMRVWSVCEHHLLPFSSTVSVGYVPNGRLLGLSKFARIAWQAAHRLQLQERMAEVIAEEVGRVADSRDLAVLVRGRHLCMEARGVKTPAVTSTLTTRGKLKDDASMRMEFLQLATGQANSIEPGEQIWASSGYP